MRTLRNFLKNPSLHAYRMSSSTSTSGSFTMKHPGHCSGMYWRADPSSGKPSFTGPPDWPRNGAVLRGNVREYPLKPENSFKWLEVTEYQQSGSKEWVSTPNCWMQFDQGGLLLHEKKWNPHITWMRSATDAYQWLNFTSKSTEIRAFVLKASRWKNRIVI